MVKSKILKGQVRRTARLEQDVQVLRDAWDSQQVREGDRAPPGAGRGGKLGHPASGCLPGP